MASVEREQQVTLGDAEQPPGQDNRTYVCVKVNLLVGCVNRREGAGITALDWLPIKARASTRLHSQWHLSFLVLGTKTIPVQPVRFV